MWPALPTIALALFEGETARNLRRCAGASEKRPPQSIYVMLFGLGLGGIACWASKISIIF
jgi:hypothetical protein